MLEVKQQKPLDVSIEKIQWDGSNPNILLLYMPLYSTYVFPDGFSTSLKNHFLKKLSTFNLFSRAAFCIIASGIQYILRYSDTIKYQFKRVSFFIYVLSVPVITNSLEIALKIDCTVKIGMIVVVNTILIPCLNFEIGCNGVAFIKTVLTCSLNHTYVNATSFL